VFDIVTRTWRQDVGVCGFVPAPRCATAYLIWEQFLLVFGGDGNNATFNDLCLLNLETTVWSRVDIPVALESRLACNCAVVAEFDTQQEGGAVLHSKRHVLYLFGGRILRIDDSRGASNDLVTVELFGPLCLALILQLPR